jgi:lauroyl/myristoyl acyltransferase
VRGENRYLGGRAVIPTAWSLEHLRTLKRTLNANGIVTVSGEHANRSAVAVEVLGVRSAFAAGAPGLAWSTDAALLTTHSYRRGPNQYTVVIDPPVAIDRGRGRRQVLAQAVETFAQRLERSIVEHPADWDAWSAFGLEIPTPFR